MDAEELVSILQDKFSGIDRQVIRAVLEENDNRLAAAEEALRSFSTRQNSGGAGPSGRAVRGHPLYKISTSKGKVAFAFEHVKYTNTGTAGVQGRIAFGPDAQHGATDTEVEGFDGLVDCMFT